MKSPYFLLAAALLVTACASNTASVPYESASAEAPQSLPQASPQLVFLDVAKFDRDLSASLVNPFEKVEVSFYDKVSPNNMPDRIQKWISTVDVSGGRIRVEPPPNEVTPKNPMILLSLISGLVNSVKVYSALQKEQTISPAKGRDVVIVLERNPSGDMVVSKVNFVKRAP